MTDLTPLEQSFQTIIDRAEGTPPAAIATADVEFGNAVTATILPRMLTLHGDDDAVLSVIARNRRIIRLEAVSPPSIWDGNTAPEDAACDAAFEEFGAPFVRSLLALSERGAARIETRLVDGDLPGTSFAGYPASRLAEDIGKVRVDPFERFIADWNGHAQAWTADEASGNEAGVNVPDSASVDAAWIEARLTEWSATCDGLEGELNLRVVRRGGDEPMTLACVAVPGGKRCVVACAAAEDFTRLETGMTALNDYYGRG